MMNYKFANHMWYLIDILVLLCVQLSRDVKGHKFNLLVANNVRLAIVLVINFGIYLLLLSPNLLLMYDITELTI
jgi:hypothetical protein